MWNTGSSLALALVLATFVLVHSVSSASTEPSVRTSLYTTDNDSTVKLNNAISVDPALQNTIIYRNDDCRLIANNESDIEHLNEHLHNEDVKLIRYLFTLDNTTTPLNTTSSKLYRPMFWAQTFSTQGLGVLLLGELYEVYSFRLLDIGVETLKIHLSQKPADCLQGKSAEELEQLLRLAVLSDLQMPSIANNSDFKGVNESQNICNQHALTESGILNISYYCCTVDKDNQLVCEYLTYTIWMKVIFWVAMILPAIVVLFLPNYLPKSMLVSKKLMESFTYKLNTIKVLRVTRITSRDQIDNSQEHKVIKMDNIKHMKQFSETVSNLAVNTTSPLQLRDIRFKVPNECVYTKEYLPTGLWDVFRRLIINCRVRKTNHLKTCCETKLCYTSVKWYMLLKEIMKFLFAVILLAPVLFRVVIFYVFEYEDAIAQEESAEKHSVNVVIQNGFTVNIPPFHPLYITACAVIGINTVVFCLVGVFCKDARYTLQFLVKSCFKDMMEDMANRGKFVRNSMKNLGLLINRCGILGLILVPLLVVLLAPFWIIYLLPLVNLLFRLFKYVIVLAPGSSCFLSRRCLFIRCYDWCNIKLMDRGVWYDMKVWKRTDNTTFEVRRPDLANSEDESSKVANNIQGGFCRQFVQWLIVNFSVLTIASLMFIIYDCICFYVDIFVYTFIGLIINFNAAAAYVSVVVLVMFYGQRCYGSVYEKYAAFFKALLSFCTKQANSYVPEYLVRLNENSRTELMFQKRSAAFHIQPAFGQTYQNIFSLYVKENEIPRWKIRAVPLLIRNTNEPCLLKTFYYNACNMPYENAPGFEGKLLLQYVKATIEFILILVFLSLVMVIVFAFGDDYNLSTTNKTIVAVMGGVVPFILTTFVFKSKNTPDWDSLLEDPYFQATVTQVLHSYEERWPIDDITVDNPSSTTFDELVNTSFIPITEMKHDNIGLFVNPNNPNIPDATRLYILDEDRTNTIVNCKSATLMMREDDAGSDAGSGSRSARSFNCCCGSRQNNSRHVRKGVMLVKPAQDVYLMAMEGESEDELDGESPGVSDDDRQTDAALSVNGMAN